MNSSTNGSTQYSGACYVLISKGKQSPKKQIWFMINSRLRTNIVWESV